MAIDFKELFYAGSRSEDVEFVLNFATEQQKKGELSDEEILKQCLSHLASCSNAEHLRRVIQLNTQISKGIESLTALNEWGNLQSIAQHALKSAIAVQEKERSTEGGPDLSQWVQANRIRLAVLQTGYAYFESVFTPEFLTNLNWTLEKDKQ